MDALEWPEQARGAWMTGDRSNHNDRRALSLSRCYEQASANARLERVHEDPSLRILPAGRPRYAEALRRCVSRLQSITGDLHLGKQVQFVV